jgi:hypothetical protein
MSLSMAAAHPGKPKRPVAIPLPDGHWWPPRAQEAMIEWARKNDVRRAPGWRELHAKVRAAGVKTSEDTVRRCVLGDLVTWDVATAVSKILGIDPPAVIAVTEDHAKALAQAPLADEVGGVVDQAEQEVERLINRLRVIRKKTGNPTASAAIETSNERPEGRGPRGRIR